MGKYIIIQCIGRTLLEKKEQIAEWCFKGWARDASKVREHRAHMSKYIIIQCLGEYCLEKKVQNLQGKDFFKSWARHVERWRCNNVIYQGTHVRRSQTQQFKNPPVGSAIYREKDNSWARKTDVEEISEQGTHVRRSPTLQLEPT